MASGQVADRGSSPVIDVIRKMSGSSDIERVLTATTGTVTRFLRARGDVIAKTISRPESQEILNVVGQLASFLRAQGDALAKTISRPEFQEALRAAARRVGPFLLPGALDEALRAGSIELLKEMRLEVRRLRSAYIELGIDCDTGVQGAEEDRNEVLRQLGQIVRSLASTAENDGLCWGCRGTALTPGGVTCVSCLVLAAEMLLEAHLLIETSGTRPDDTVEASSDL